MYCINMIWTYLKACLQREFLRAMLYAALIVYMIFWDSVPRDHYVPKSKRSILTRMAYEYCGLLKSWLKPAWKRWEYFVFSMKTNNHRRKGTKSFGSNAKQSNQVFPPYRKRKRRNLIRLICVMHASNDLRARRTNFDTDSKPIRVDNCASKCISPHIEDFVDCPVPVKCRKIKGISGTLSDVRKGTLKWQIEDDDGVKHDVIIPGSYYVPEASSRLLSPQHWAQTAKDNKPKPRGTWCATYDDSIELWWGQRKYKRTLPLDPKETNVGTMQSAPGYKRYSAFCSEIGEDDEDYDVQDDVAFPSESHTVTDDEQDSESDEEDEATSDYVPESRESPLTTDFDLNGPKDQDKPNVVEDEEDQIPQDVQAEFLRWHHRLGHISAKKIKVLAKLGILPARLANCNVPYCTSCLFGKATRRPWRHKKSKTKTSKVATRPGECVSVDQLESTTPGLLGQMKGIPTKMRYRAATVFIDQFSGLGYVYLQKTTNADETILAKEAFERYCASHGVTVQHYHADNGRFADNKWRQHCASKRQTLSFCGVNAHFQNGVAERRIRELQDHARTMLIHASRRWPNAIDSHLWPYALRMANDIANHTPDLKRKVIPIEQFAGTKVATNPKDWYHFGCPVYVANAKVQAGKKVSKWSERARVGIYLGHSPQHARTVGLVLSLTTGLLSPQFHIKPDTTFHTLRKAFDGRFPTSKWQDKCHFLTEDDAKQSQQASTNPPVGTSASEGARSPVTDASGPEPEQDDRQEGTQDLSGVQHRHSVTFEDPEGAPEAPEPQGRQSEDDTTGLRRSRRSIRSPRRLIEEAMAAELSRDSGPYDVAYEVLAEPKNDEAPDENEHPLLAFAASSDPDTMYFHEAMQQADRKQFLEAAAKEVNDQTKNGNWKLVHKSQVPQDATILPAVWSMKRKRRIMTGEIYKWKARLNIDGSKQTKGVNYWESYAAVASWAAIRLILILSILNNWHTKQIDFVLAYPQAPVEVDNLYMKIPRGFEVEGAAKGEYLLHIQRNIYGQKQAGRVWNKYLVSKLIDIGFKQSLIDESVFYRGNVIYALYTDDSILAGPDENEINKAIQDMTDIGLDLTEEGDISDFLGVNIERKADGSVHLTQPQLINRILEDLNLASENVSTKQTPATASRILKRDADGELFDGHFDYRSVIGRLGYLEKCTRPDLSCASHAAARFSSDPKKSHSIAVKWIGKYLAGTKDKGLIFKPSGESFDVFCDADFSGSWDPQATDDPDTARSRTGFVIKYAGCPILWASKLQSLIALSTTEAEYISLSTALREVIPLMELIREMRDQGFDIKSATPTVHCKVFEDNSGALEIATVHKVRPRTKHLNVQLHHFRQYVDQGDITIHKIDTEDQESDLLTKNLSFPLFSKHRFSIMGW